MQIILSTLTAGLLLLHALAGCCWHHAHACAECDESPARASHACSGCADRGSSPLDDEQPEGPCRCQLECHGVCNYLPNSKTHLDAAALTVPLHLAAITLAPCGIRVVYAVSWQMQRAAQEAPPLRLHLLQQVLLT